MFKTIFQSKKTVIISFLLLALVIILIVATFSKNNSTPGYTNTVPAPPASGGNAGSVTPLQYPLIKAYAFNSNVDLYGVDASTVMNSLQLPGFMYIYYGRIFTLATAVGRLGLHGYNGEFVSDKYVIQKTSSDVFTIDTTTSLTNGSITSRDAQNIVDDFLRNDLGMTAIGGYTYTSVFERHEFVVTLSPTVVGYPTYALDSRTPLVAEVSTGGQLMDMTFTTFPYSFEKSTFYPLRALSDMEHEAATGSGNIGEYAPGLLEVSTNPVSLITPPAYSFHPASLGYYFDAKSDISFPVVNINGRFQNYDGKIYSDTILIPAIGDQYFSFLIDTVAP